MKDTYDDILHLPRPAAYRTLPMDRLLRAGLFAPFAALTGLEARMDAAEAIHLSGDEEIKLLLGKGRGKKRM